MLYFSFIYSLYIYLFLIPLGSTAKRSYIKKKTILHPRTPETFGSNYSHHHSDTDLPPNMSHSLNRSISSLNEYKVSIIQKYLVHYNKYLIIINFFLYRIIRLVAQGIPLLQTIVVIQVLRQVQIVSMDHLVMIVKCT